MAGREHHVRDCPDALAGVVRVDGLGLAFLEDEEPQDLLKKTRALIGVEDVLGVRRSLEDHEFLWV